MDWTPANNKEAVLSIQKLIYEGKADPNQLYFFVTPERVVSTVSSMGRGNIDLKSIDFEWISRFIESEIGVNRSEMVKIETGQYWKKGWALALPEGELIGTREKLGDWNKIHPGIWNIGGGMSR